MNKPTSVCWVWLQTFEWKDLNELVSLKLTWLVKTIKADSHIACRSHAAPMPFPCHAVPLRVHNVSFPFDLHSAVVSDSHLPCHAPTMLFFSWHGHCIASVNQTRSHCVNQMWKTHSRPLAIWHGRGTAWTRHGNGMLYVNRPFAFL